MNNDKEVKVGISLGGCRVGIRSDPTNDADVFNIKLLSAELIDYLESLDFKDGEAKRLKCLAQTAYEEAAMWAVKALTKSKYRDGDEK